MKLLRTLAWLKAFKKAWHEPRRSGHDPADMGTAFGLDSITVIEDFENAGDSRSGPASRTPHWQRRLERSSRF